MDYTKFLYISNGWCAASGALSRNKREQGAGSREQGIGNREYLRRCFFHS